MKYLKVYTDFAADMEQLSDAETGRLFRAMLSYAETGEEPSFGGNEKFLWGTAKKHIDAQRKCYARKVESIEAAREQNPNNNKTVSEQTENSPEQNSNAQQPAQEQEQETRPRNKTKNKTTERKDTPSGGAGGERDPMVSRLMAGYSEELRTAVDEWLRYKHEKRQTYQPIGLSNLLKKIMRYADNCGEQAVIAAIYDAMSSNYQGIVWDKLVKKPQQPQQPRQQNGGMQAKYDMMDRWRNGRK